MDLSKYAAGTKKYMSKDLWNPQEGENLTIASIEEVTFTDRSGKTEIKPVVSWVEDRPPLALNRTNMAWIISTFGPTEKDYQGRKLHVFHDPSVTWAGKKVGGVVLDKPQLSPRAKSLKEQIATAIKEMDPDDQIPF